MQIHRIRGIAFSSYLIETPSALFLIDTGFLGFEQLIVDRIRSIGRRVEDLELVALTHPHLDHVGGLANLRRRTSFDVLAHPSAASALADGGREFSPSLGGWSRAVEVLARVALPLMRLPRITPTLELPDGARLDALGLAATVLHTPGHTASCLSLVLDDGTAFTGDLVIGVGHGTRVVAPPGMAVDAAAALTSVRKVLAAGARRILPAHGRELTAADVRDMLRRLGEPAGDATPGVA